MHWKIYKITNTVNQKIYIGITKNDFKVRWANHVRSKKCPILNAAIKKYGPNKFTMEEIDSADSLKEALRKETFYIKSFNSLSKNGGGYNVTEDTEGCLYSREVKEKMFVTRRDNKKAFSVKDEFSTPYFGISFNKKYQCWGFSFMINGKKYRGDRYGSDYETAIARDVQLSKLVDKDECLCRLNFPENYEKYLSGEIELPNRKVRYKVIKVDFNFVRFVQKDFSWRSVVFKTENFKENIIASSGGFSSAEDAAEMSDFLNIKHLGDRDKLNFPNKELEYSNPNYLPPLTNHQKNTGSPFSNISYYNYKGRISYRLQLRNKGRLFRESFQTLAEAIDYRNKIVLQYGINIPMDRPDLIELKNLDKEIWSIR